MDLEKLKYAIEVQNCGSINKAAAKLYLTQPYLSACIKSLEEKLGVHLFLRSNKGTRVTPEGEEFFNQAQDILLQFEQLEHRYLKKGAPPAPLHITSVRSVMVAEAFQSFYHAHCFSDDLFEISFTECGLTQVVESVSQNEASLGVVMFYPNQKDYMSSLLHAKKLHFTPIGSLSACIILSQDHPLAHEDYEVLRRDLPNYAYATYGDYIDSILDVINECAFGGIKVPDRIVYTRDRYSLMQIINSTDNFSVSHLFSKEGETRFNVKSIPLPTDERLQFGYIQSARGYFRSSNNETKFIYFLKKSIQKYQDNI